MTEPLTIEINGQQITADMATVLDHLPRFVDSLQHVKHSVDL